VKYTLAEKLAATECFLGTRSVARI